MAKLKLNLQDTFDTEDQLADPAPPAAAPAFTMPVAATQDDPGPDPTVGRIVHFWSADYAEQGLFNGKGAGPYAALVTQVFTNEAGVVTYVNLLVFPPFANPLHEGSVAHGSRNFADARRWWTWPPRV